MATSCWRFVRLSVGAFVTSVQLVVVKSKFACNAKSIEVTVQERKTLPPERAMFSSGAGTECEVQIPPPLTTATNLPPSAEVATELQFATVTLFDTQVFPASIEIKMAPPPTATKWQPSAEEAI